MQSYKICGGKMLSGKIKVEGSKNALLPIIAASILVKDIVELENVTPLEDTYAMIDILRFILNKKALIIFKLLTLNYYALFSLPNTLTLYSTTASIPFIPGPIILLGSYTSLLLASVSLTNFVHSC